ncbi:MAG: hypothetical protein HY706_22505 [Candidatus Hydrogenedentes bacterium]|nr:hypothetical protein [Candidatus Hydrogenedentota bacterium]
MLGMWLGGLRDPEPVVSQRTAAVPDHSSRIKELEHHIGRITLLNQALWELLREKLNLTDPELERRVNDIDMRDGVQDGRITNTALQCPRCHRVSSSKHWKCLYCGLEFEKPAMG